MERATEARLREAAVEDDALLAGSKRPQPRADGDPDLAQLAMHGFMNVPAELAAALVASDGGTRD